MEALYFNKRACVHIVCVICFLILIDFLLFKFLSDLSAISIGYYIKLIMCVGYASTSNQLIAFTQHSNKTLTLASHIILIYCCYWMTIVGIVFWPDKVSSNLGLIMIVAGGCLYIVANEVIFYLESKSKRKLGFWLAVELTSNFLVMITFAFALYLIIVGEWKWLIKTPLVVFR